MTVTQERVLQLLNYDQDTGIFTWKVARGGTRGVGAVAGRVNPGNGYIDICIDYRRYLGHRLAWLYMTGEWPTNDVDHKDRNRRNNAWSNLRAATRSQNLANAGGHKTRKAPYKGIQRNGKAWQAVICARGVRRCLGTYNSPEEAARAYQQAAIALNGEYAAAA